MTAAGVADALRLMGRSNQHQRIAYNLADRENEWRHPLAEAHRSVSRRLHRAATEALSEAMSDGLMLYERDDRRTPADWRREGERAARCFEIGLAFAEALEDRAQARRRTDAERREELDTATRIMVVAPSVPHLELAVTR